MKRLFIALLLFLGLSCWAAAARAADRPPNFVFILIDDLGWRDLGCYGSTFYETPHLDALAKSGVRFTAAYSACPVCSPTRAAIMTGKHPVRAGITDWIPGESSQGHKLQTPEDLSALPLAEVTIAEALRDAGYATGYFGKWHLGGEGCLPTEQGFEVNVGGYHAGSPKSYYSPYKNPHLPDGPEGEYLTDRLTDEALKFIEQQRDTPFFVFLSHYTVHTPIQACRRHLEKFQKKSATLQEKLVDESEGAATTKVRQDSAAYASMLYALDENIGRLTAKLEALGLADSTVVIFTADNGGLSTLRRGVGPTSVRPLRAGKGWCYEGGIRVPFIVRAPGVTKAESVCDEPVVSMDFFPTLLALAGVELQPQRHVDGVSLLSILKDQSATLERDALYWHYPHYHGSGWTTGGAVRAGEWKLVEFFETGEAQLFHLAEDESEQRDLAAEQPERQRALREQLSRWRAEVGAKLPTARQAP